MNNGHLNQILLITDGCSNHGEDPLAMAAFAKEQGITVNVIGIMEENQIDPEAMKEVEGIALAGGGVHQVVYASQLSQTVQMAQTHEFSNKLYAILGLLELGEYDEAIDLIKEEYAIQNEQHDLLFHNIHSQQVQAILLGKISKASEKKVKLVIDENSSLAPLPAHIGLSHLITIIGNLIDNAFEAVAEQSVKEVLFFITDMGHDIVIEVSDTGPGVPPEKIEAVFERGYSSKGMRRGYGLANVKDSVRELGGWIELANQKTGGAVFTVFIPKEKQRGNPFDSHRDCGG